MGDADLTSRTFAGWIGAAPGFRCVSFCPNGQTALASLQKINPPVVLLDIHLPDMSGIDCLRSLKRLLPGTEFVIVTAHEDAGLICEVLRAGANGCLSKRAGKKELLAALRAVHAGGSPLDHRIARQIVQTFRPSQAEHLTAAGLSSRQLEVLELLAQGQSFVEITNRLNVTMQTTNTHVRRIYKKLNVKSRSQAVATYLQVQNPLGALHASAVTAAFASRVETTRSLAHC